jgi:hypothetical protein
LPTPLSSAFGSHAAGIDHDQVIILFALEALAGGPQAGRDRFGIADVHLASVGVENKRMAVRNRCLGSVGGFSFTGKNPS